MLRETPTFVCDTCERFVGKEWRCEVIPEMEVARLHFCNNHCKGRYQGDTSKAWVSANWPLIK